MSEALFASTFRSEKRFTHSFGNERSLCQFASNFIPLKKRHACALSSNCQIFFGGNGRHAPWRKGTQNQLISESIHYVKWAAGIVAYNRGTKTLFRSQLADSRYIRYDAVDGLTKPSEPASCLIPLAASLLHRLPRLRPVGDRGRSWPNRATARRVLVRRSSVPESFARESPISGIAHRSRHQPSITGTIDRGNRRFRTCFEAEEHASHLRTSGRRKVQNP